MIPADDHHIAHASGANLRQKLVVHRRCFGRGVHRVEHIARDDQHVDLPSAQLVEEPVQKPTLFLDP